jgi:uncharacterized protein YjdB
MSWREVTSFGRTHFEFPTTLAQYTKATAPVATLPIMKHSYITISDGGTSDTPILALCNGTNWVAFGAAAATILGVASSVTVTPQAPTILYNATQQLAASVVVSAGGLNTVTWASGTEAAATIDANGLVTGVAEGTTIITATSVQTNTVHGHTTITVQGTVTSVALDHATLTVAALATHTLVPTVVVAGGAPETVTWVSSVPGIATVNASGVVTGVATGETTVTATSTRDATKYASCVITVPA